MNLGRALVDKQKRIELGSLADTQRIAALVARSVHGGEILSLLGDLGTGKTTFVRLFLEALGSPQRASSPTYVLQHEYSTARPFTLEHWDLYRLASAPAELLVPAPHAVRVVEWADRGGATFVDASDLVLRFDLDHTGARAVAISGANLELLTPLFALAT